MGKVFWLVIIFIVVGGYIIQSNMRLDLNDDGDRSTFVKEMGKWLFQVGKNTKDTVGYAVSQDWLPDKDQADNETNTTKTFLIE